METILTAQELQWELGASVKALRLQKNLDRQTLCERAGISLNALKHLESGQGATVTTLIRVIRALGRQDWLAGLAPTISINPLHVMRGKSTRQRASKRTETHGKANKSKTL